MVDIHAVERMRRINEHQERDRREVFEATPLVLALARMLHNIALSHSPEKHCAENDLPAPLYVHQATVLQSDQQTREDVQRLLCEMLDG